MFLEVRRISLATVAACLAYAGFSAGLGLTPIALLLLGTTFLTADPHAPDAGEQPLSDEGRPSRRSSRRSSGGDHGPDDRPRDSSLDNHDDDDQDGGSGMSRCSSTQSLCDMADEIENPNGEDSAGVRHVQQPDQDLDADLGEWGLEAKSSPQCDTRRSALRVRRPAAARRGGVAPCRPLRAVTQRGGCATKLPVALLARALYARRLNATVAVSVI